MRSLTYETELGMFPLILAVLNRHYSTPYNENRTASTRGNIPVRSLFDVG